MNKHLPKFLALLCVVFSLSMVAQDHDHEGHDHEHGDAHQHVNEISMATGVVPLPKEDNVTIGFHLHYVRGLGKSKRFGVGLGLEYILDEHKHYTVSTVFLYRIYKGLTMAYAPGLLILLDEHGNETGFAQHIEAAYEFEVGQFHIGPMAEVGIEPTQVHYMFGVHFGVDF